MALYNQTALKPIDYVPSAVRSVPSSVFGMEKTHALFLLRPFWLKTILIRKSTIYG
jgi:hypothetical protein